MNWVIFVYPHILTKPILVSSKIYITTGKTNLRKKKQSYKAAAPIALERLNDIREGLKNV